MSVFWIFKTPGQIDVFAKRQKERLQNGETPAFEETDPKRSLDQNSMAFEIYKRIGQQLYGNDLSHARAECKLRHGIPIIRGSNEKFKASYDRCIKHLDYETKLEFIKETEFPVTRLMGKKQMSQYISTLFAEYSQLGVNFDDLGNVA